MKLNLIFLLNCDEADIHLEEVSLLKDIVFQWKVKEGESRR